MNPDEDRLLELWKKAGKPLPAGLPVVEPWATPDWKNRRTEALLMEHAEEQYGERLEWFETQEGAVARSVDGRLYVCESTRLESALKVVSHVFNRHHP